MGERGQGLFGVNPMQLNPQQTQQVMSGAPAQQQMPLPQPIMGGNMPMQPGARMMPQQPLQPQAPPQMPMPQQPRRGMMPGSGLMGIRPPMNPMGHGMMPRMM